jgi:hypothetical protein
MMDETIDLDPHRGMAAHKATVVHRLHAGFETAVEAEVGDASNMATAEQQTGNDAELSQSQSRL